MPRTKSGEPATLEERNLMSILSATYLAEPGWGLPEEHLNEIIGSENLKDVTKSFLGQIKPLIEKFDSLFAIRILTFDELGPGYAVGLQGDFYATPIRIIIEISPINPMDRNCCGSRKS